MPIEKFDSDDTEPKKCDFRDRPIMVMVLIFFVLLGFVFIMIYITDDVATGKVFTHICIVASGYYNDQCADQGTNTTVCACEKACFGWNNIPKCKQNCLSYCIFRNVTATLATGNKNEIVN